MSAEEFEFADLSFPKRKQPNLALLYERSPPRRSLEYIYTYYIEHHGTKCPQLTRSTPMSRLGITSNNFWYARPYDRLMEACKERCRLLQDLPPELRLLIYEHLFDGSYQASLLIRSSNKTEVISQARAHVAILRTCKTIYKEAVSLVPYAATTFKAQVYPENPYPSFRNSGNLRTPWLLHVQNLEIKIFVLHPAQTKQALHLLWVFAGALEAADAKITSLQVTSNIFGSCSGRNLAIGMRAIHEAVGYPV